MNNINTKTISWVLIGLVVVVGTVILASRSNNPGGNAQTANTASTTTPSASPGAGKAASTPAHTNNPAPAKTPVAAKAKLNGYDSVDSLISLKEPLVCTVQVSALNPKRSGTIYVADGKMRGNFLLYINGVAIHTSMIDDGSYLYGWTTGATKGLKLLAASSVSSGVISSHGGIGLTTPFSFACNNWVINQDVFVPPASVTFSNNP